MAMIKLQCEGCSRVIDYNEFDFNDYLTCRECGEDFEKIDEDFSEKMNSGEVLRMQEIASLPKLKEEVMDKFDPDKKTIFD